MTEAAISKREQNTARTRERLVTAAVQLYGARSIDAVSLREVSVAAGQRNTNALQYHFRDRDGLLQAIVDKHATAITQLREHYIQQAGKGERDWGVTAARCLVLPIIDYVEANPGGLNYVKIVSQLAALYQNGTVSHAEDGIHFPRNEAMEAVFAKALGALTPREAQRRIFLVVDITFHAIADIYRAAKLQSAGSPLASRKAMIEQLVLLLDAFFSAPSPG